MEEKSVNEDVSTWELVDEKSQQIDEDNDLFSIGSAPQSPVKEMYGSHIEDPAEKKEKAVETPTVMIFRKPSVNVNDTTINDRISIEATQIEAAIVKEKLNKCMNCCVVM